MADRSRGVLGQASRGVVAEIDEKLAELDGKLSPYEPLVAERERLRAARAALMGEGPAPAAPRITQDDLIGYLIENPGSRASAAAKFFGVPLTTVSAHFYRGKLTTFVSRGKGWYVREQAAKRHAARKGK